MSSAFSPVSSSCILITSSFTKNACQEVAFGCLQPAAFQRTAAVAELPQPASLNRWEITTRGGGGGRNDVAVLVVHAVQQQQQEEEEEEQQRRRRSWSGSGSRSTSEGLQQQQKPQRKRRTCNNPLLGCSWQVPFLELCSCLRLCLLSAQMQQMWAKESEFRAFLQSTGWFTLLLGGSYGGLSMWKGTC